MIDAVKPYNPDDYDSSDYDHEPRDLDLGVMRSRRVPVPEFYAPGTLTRGVWLLGALGCLVYLYSVAVSFGWFGSGWFERWPTLSETPFWLLPLLLAGVSLLLAAGGARLTVREAGLELRGFWPRRSRSFFSWSELRATRFFEERTRSREQLYGVCFSFVSAEVTVRFAESELWRALRARFAKDVIDSGAGVSPGRRCL